MHDWVKDFIYDYLEESKVPIQAPALRQAIKSEMQLELSSKMLDRYLRDELGLSYRKIKPINDAHNKQ